MTQGNATKGLPRFVQLISMVFALSLAGCGGSDSPQLSDASNDGSGVQNHPGSADLYTGAQKSALYDPGSSSPLVLEIRNPLFISTATIGESIRKALPSLMEQTGAMDLQILVAGDQDGTIYWLSTQPDNRASAAREELGPNRNLEFCKITARVSLDQSGENFVIQPARVKLVGMGILSDGSAVMDRIGRRYHTLQTASSKPSRNGIKRVSCSVTRKLESGTLDVPRVGDLFKHMSVLSDDFSLHRN